MVNYNSIKDNKTRKINKLVPAKLIAQHIDFSDLKQLYYSSIILLFQHYYKLF